MLDITAVRHTFPTHPGFCIDRKQGYEEYTFLHFHTPVDLLVDGKRIRTLPHAVILYEPGHLQYFTAREGFIHDWLHFTGTPDFSLLSRFQPNRLYYPKHFDFIPQLVAEMENEYFSDRSNRQEMLSLQLKTLLIKIDRSLDENDTTQSPVSTDLEARFRAFRCRLFSSLGEHWSVSAMAQQLGFSESRFSVLYKAVFGISPTQDLISARVNAAQNMLIFQNRRIEDISTALGYQNVTHFIRQFKAATGMTPSAYRKTTQ